VYGVLEILEKRTPGRLYLPVVETTARIESKSGTEQRLENTFDEGGADEPQVRPA
jgi:hypothetical protein